MEAHLATGRPVYFGVAFHGHFQLRSTDEAFTPIPRLRAIEEHALECCSGRILDVGAGSGRHSLLLRERGLETLPIDSEPRCVSIMAVRGLHDAQCLDVFDLSTERFDTILILQQSVGFVGSLSRLVDFLSHIARLLNPGGQILLDSMVSYAHARGPGYPGMVEVQLRYDRTVGPTFPWLYVDVDTLSLCARYSGLTTELLLQGPSRYDYLARLVQPTGA